MGPFQRYPLWRLYHLHERTSQFCHHVCSCTCGKRWDRPKFCCPFCEQPPRLHVVHTLTLHHPFSCLLPYLKYMSHFTGLVLAMWKIHQSPSKQISGEQWPKSHLIMYELSGVLVLITGVGGFMERVSELNRGLVGIRFTHELGSLFWIAVPWDLLWTSQCISDLRWISLNFNGWSGLNGTILQ